MRGGMEENKGKDKRVGWRGESEERGGMEENKGKDKRVGW